MEQSSCPIQFLNDALSVSFEGSSDLSVQQLLDSPLIEKTVTVQVQPNNEPLSANCSSTSVQGNFSLEEDDLFQCGRCKSQFSSLPKFMYHKRVECLGKVPQRFSDEKLSLEDDDPPLDHVAASITNQVTVVDQSQVSTYVCEPPNQSINTPVTEEGEFLNLTLNGNQVFALNGNFHLTTSEDEGKELINLNVPATLLQAGSACSMDLGSEVLTSTSLVPEIIETSILAKTRVDASSIPSEVCNLPDVDSAASREEVTNLDHEFFHRGMAKNSHSKGQIIRNKHHCPFCEREFSKNFDLQQHIRSHTGEKPYQCVVCGRPFAQKSNVNKHMATHKVWPKDSIHCTLPKEPIKTIQNEVGNEQVKEEILVDDSYVCQFCFISVNSYSKLRSHMKMHNDRKVFKCIQGDCDATFPEMESFLDHIRKHSKDVKYNCHYCSKAFSSLSTLAYHQLEHSLYPRPKKTFGPNYFRCTKCMNKYSSPEALEHHRKTASHHFPCQQCSKIFHSERFLRKHLHHHGTTQVFNCPTCSKNFKYEYSLKVHLVTHSNERPYACYLCGNAFNRKDKLKRHMLIHQDKKFKCPFKSTHGCVREFRRRDKLRLHVLTHAFPPSKKRLSKDKNCSKGCSKDTKPPSESKCPRRIKHFANIIRGAKHKTKQNVARDFPPTKSKPVICEKDENVSSEDACSTHSAVVTRTKSGSRARSDYSKYAEPFKKSVKIKNKKIVEVSPSSQAPLGKPSSKNFVTNKETKTRKSIFFDSCNLSSPSDNNPFETSSEFMFKHEAILPQNSESFDEVGYEFPSHIKDERGLKKHTSKLKDISSMENEDDSPSVVKINYFPISLEEELLHGRELLTSMVVKEESEVEEDSSITLEVDSSYFSGSNEEPYSKDTMQGSPCVSQENKEVANLSNNAEFFEFGNNKIVNATISYGDHVFMQTDIPNS